MKVVYFTYILLEDGSSIALLNCVNSLIKKGITPVLIMSKRSPKCAELDANNISYYIIPYRFANVKKFSNCIYTIVFTIPFLLYMIVQNFFAKAKILTLLKEIKPDIIHTNVGPIHLGYEVAQRLGIPHIWHLREIQGGGIASAPFPSLSNYIKKLNRSYVITISRFVSNYFKLHEDYRVIYDGVFDIDNNSECLKFSQKIDSFLFVGRIEDAKGVDILINAFLQFHKEHPSFKLQLVGGGTKLYISKLHKWIIKNNLEKDIELLGIKKNVYELIQKSKAVIVSSKLEGFGFVAAEAMYNKTLVIGYDHSGTKEQFDNGVAITGKEIALRYKSSKELIDNMSKMVGISDEEYNDLVTTAKQAVCNLYTIQYNANQIYDYYCSILLKK